MNPHRRNRPRRRFLLVDETSGVVTVLANDHKKERVKAKVSKNRIPDIVDESIDITNKSVETRLGNDYDNTHFSSPILRQQNLSISTEELIKLNTSLNEIGNTEECDCYYKHGQKDRSKIECPHKINIKAVEDARIKNWQYTTHKPANIVKHRNAVLAQYEYDKAMFESYNMIPPEMIDIQSALMSGEEIEAESNRLIYNLDSLTPTMQRAVNLVDTFSEQYTGVRSELTDLTTQVDPDNNIRVPYKRIFDKKMSDELTEQAYDEIMDSVKYEDEYIKNDYLFRKTVKEHKLPGFGRGDNNFDEPTQSPNSSNDNHVKTHPQKTLKQSEDDTSKEKKLTLKEYIMTKRRLAFCNKKRAILLWPKINLINTKKYSYPTASTTFIIEHLSGRSLTSFNSFYGNLVLYCEILSDLLEFTLENRAEHDNKNASRTANLLHFSHVFKYDKLNEVYNYVELRNKSRNAGLRISFELSVLNSRKYLCLSNTERSAWGNCFDIIRPSTKPQETELECMDLIEFIYPLDANYYEQLKTQHSTMKEKSIQPLGNLSTQIIY